MTVAVTGGSMAAYPEGTPVELTCTVTGDNPAATIQWQKDGTNVPSTAGGTASPLSISSIADSGAYSCIATNSVAGVTSSNTETVTIQGEC